MKQSVSTPMKIQNSREYTDASSLLDGISRQRTIANTIAATAKNSKYASNWPDRPRSVKECTDVSPSTPLRVRNVEYKIRTNVAITRITEAFNAVSLFLYEIMVWMEPTSTSQGTYTPFSTGSQFQ